VSDDDERWHWHDQRGVTWAAGAAAVALIVLVVVAVLRRGLSAFSQGALPPGEHTATGDSRDAT
jgi:hypothetical protein